MKSLFYRASDVFLYCFAAFLGIFAVASVIIDSARLEMVASIASITGVFFTSADFFSCVKQGNEKFLELVDKLTTQASEQRSLEKLRIHKLMEYCQFKYNYERNLPERARIDRECVLLTYKKAFDILEPLDRVMDPMLREKELATTKAKLDVERRKKNLKSLGVFRDILLGAGFISIFILLYLYETIPIPARLPNVLTIVSFGLIMLVYAFRGQLDDALEASEEYVRDTIAKSEEDMTNERIRIKQIETAMCEDPKILSQEADARLLIFLMYVLDANEVGDY